MDFLYFANMKNRFLKNDAVSNRGKTKSIKTKERKADYIFLQIMSKIWNKDKKGSSAKLSQCFKIQVTKRSNNDLVDVIFIESK